MSLSLSAHALQKYLAIQRAHPRFLRPLAWRSSQSYRHIRGGGLRAERATADSMQTLRKPLETGLLGECPVFPFDPAVQPVAI